jgi:hypothetical protein
MRKPIACVLAATLLWGMGGGLVRAGDDDTDDGDSKPAERPAIRWSPVFAHMVHVDNQAPAQDKSSAKTDKDSPAKDSEPKKPKKVETFASRARSREEAALIRRLEVCDKLMEAAIRTNDRELESRVYDLEAKAQAIYARNTAKLSDNRASAGSNTKSGSSSSARSTDSLDLAGKVARKNTDSQASIGEVNP